MVEENKWYTSHNVFITVREMVAIEVEDRNNYSLPELVKSFNDSNILMNYDDMCIWVTKDKKIGSAYFEIDASNGVIIEGTDDGDGGVLFVDNPTSYIHEPTKKLKILRKDFIEWYFGDCSVHDFIPMGILQGDLVGGGEFILTAQELLDQCEYIPKSIVYNPEDYPENYRPTGSEFEMKLHAKNFTKYVKEKEN
jgi:hypothetical protein